jgi:hypothetical protein
VVDLGQAEDNFPSFVLSMFIVLPSNFYAFESNSCKPFHEGKSGDTSASNAKNKLRFIIPGA